MLTLSHHGTVTLATTWVFTAVAFVSVFSSAIWRVRTKQMDVSDWLTIAAFVIGCLISIQTTWAILLEGRKQHQQEFTEHQLNFLATSLIVNEILWTLTNGLIRGAAWFILWRIFHSPHKFARRTLSVLAILIILHALIAILEVLLICQPISAQWSNGSTGLCANQKSSFVAIEGLGLWLDVCLLAFPAYHVLRLNFKWRQKVAVVMVLDMGVVLIAVTALRLKSLHLATSDDFVFARSYLGLLSAIGAMLGITFCTTTFYAHLFKGFRDVIRQHASFHASGTIISGRIMTVFGFSARGSAGRTNFFTRRSNIQSQWRVSDHRPSISRHTLTTADVDGLILSDERRVMSEEQSSISASGDQQSISEYTFASETRSNISGDQRNVFAEAPNWPLRV